MKRRIPKLVALCLVLAFALSIPVISKPLVVEAKVQYVEESKQPKTSTSIFKDVKKSTKYRKDIEKLYKYGAFKGWVKKGKKFKPDTTITRRQFCTMLDNMYGDRINLRVKNPDGKCTQKFATKTLDKVSRQLGYHVSWSGGSPKSTITRQTACHYITEMMKWSDKLKPTTK